MEDTVDLILRTVRHEGVSKVEMKLDTAMAQQILNKFHSQDLEGSLLINIKGDKNLMEVSYER